MGASLFALEGGKGEENYYWQPVKDFSREEEYIHFLPKQSSSVAAASKSSPLRFPFPCCSLSSLEQHDFTKAEDTFCSVTEARTP